MDLIEATEECGVAGVYAYLKRAIADWKISGEGRCGFDTSNLNTAMISNQATCLSLTIWSGTSKPRRESA